MVAVLSKAGDQLPLIALVEVVGNGDNAVPEHIAATAANVGVTGELTIMVSVVVVAHCPAVGVNVYVVVAVLSSAGDHEPLMPLVDVVGKALKAPPEQIAATAANVGVMIGSMVTKVVAVTIEQPGAAGMV